MRVVIDAISNGTPNETPVLQRSGDSVDLVAMFDGTASWAYGHEVATRAHAAVARMERLPRGFHEGMLVRMLRGAFRRIPAEWKAEGIDASIAAVIVRGLDVTVLVSGLFAALHVPAGGPARIIWRPRRLVDVWTEQGRITREQADTDPARDLLLGPFFDGTPDTLLTFKFTVTPSDRIVIASYGLSEIAPTDNLDSARSLRDRLAASAGPRPTAILRWS